MEYNYTIYIILTLRSGDCERYDRALPGRAYDAGIGSECSDREEHYALDPSETFLHPAIV